MSDQFENRAFERAPHELPVHYKQKDADKFIGGVMRNYSEAGICFETGNAIKPGTEIFVIIENVINMPNNADNCQLSYATVEWCRANPNCNAFCYDVGIRFFNM